MLKRFAVGCASELYVAYMLVVKAAIESERRIWKSFFDLEKILKIFEK